MPHRPNHEPFGQALQGAEHRTGTDAEADRTNRLVRGDIEHVEGRVEITLNAVVGQRSEHLPQAVDDGGIRLALGPFEPDQTAVAVIEVGHGNVVTDAG